MTLAETSLGRLGGPNLSRDELALERCRAAADLEHRGQYEAALAALAELWRGVGRRPALEGLSERAAAEVLLRAGTLSGWFGSARQLEGAQDAAKDLISESISRFQSLGETARVADARSELGFCYYRAGSYDEARVLYHEALKSFTADGGGQELRATILLRLAIVESCTGRYNDALRTLTDGARLFEETDDNALKGKFHNELACALMFLADAERRPDYRDRAIIEYTAASHHFGRAGHTRYRARAENNLGYLLYAAGHYEGAHEHLNCARRLFVGARDEGSVAQVDETRARLLLAEGRVREAETVIRSAVRTLGKGDEQALLAEALTTQGRVLARAGDFAASLGVLKRAADTAEQAGSFEDAGRALLTLIEEHAGRVDERELFETYRRANGLLNETQDAETVARLRDCAARIVSVRLDTDPQPAGRSRIDFWANFSLPERVRAYEARYIRRALSDAQGSVTKAARLLGLNHPTKLASILKGRHREIAHLRTPPETRRRSLIRINPARTHAKAGKRAAAVKRDECSEAVVAAKGSVEDAG